MNTKFFRLTVLLMIAAVLLTTAAEAQKKPAKRSEKNSAEFEVRLPISVIDKKRQPVAGLSRHDFIVLENGRRQKISSFTDEKTNAPVYVGVLMDSSPSTKGKMAFMKEAARNLVYTITRSQKDKAAFLTYDEQIRLIQDFTGKIDLLDNAIVKTTKTGKQNSLYDAVYQFCDEKMRNVGGRRALVIMADGKDDFSRAKLADAIDIAQRTETVIYFVSINGGFMKTAPDAKTETVNDTNNKLLSQLAAETGGAVFFVGDRLDLDRSLAAIIKEIRAQYVVTYRPKNRKYDGRERRLEVQFASRKKYADYKIRTKTKYRRVKPVLRQ